MAPGSSAVSRAEQSTVQIVAESLAATPAVQGWFMEAVGEAVGLEIEVEPNRIDLRPDHAAGETGYDFAVYAGCGALSVVYLVTVAAQFEPRRATLAAEARETTRRDGGALVYAVLLCLADDPEESAAAGARYDCVVELARLREVFAADAAGRGGEAGAHLVFQRRLFERNERLIRDWLEGGAAGAQSFREAYLAFIESVDASLPVSAARQVFDDDAPTMIAFDADALPRWGFMPKVRLAHHLKKGLVSILIEGWGGEVDELAGIMDPSLHGTGYKLAVAPSRMPGDRAGLLILADAPSLDPEKPFEGQRQTAYDCVQVAVKLRRWYLARRSAARYWAEQADPSLAGEGEGRVLRHIDLE